MKVLLELHSLQEFRWSSNGAPTPPEIPTEPLGMKVLLELHSLQSWCMDVMDGISLQLRESVIGIAMCNQTISMSGDVFVGFRVFSSG